MTQIDERTIGDLVVRIDRHVCVGFEDCIVEADGVFALDVDGVAVFVDGAEAADRDLVIRACESCPVDALSVHDRDGRQLVP